MPQAIYLNSVNETAIRCIKRIIHRDRCAISHNPQNLRGIVSVSIENAFSGALYFRTECQSILKGRSLQDNPKVCPIVCETMFYTKYVVIIKGKLNRKPVR